MNKRIPKFILLAALTASMASMAWGQAAAPVKAEGAWARASVQGQKGTGAFMTLTASEPLTLVGASSPAAGVTEVHEMKMDGDVMRMRAVAGLDLPAGKPVALSPGGYHLMMMDLKAPLQKDSTVPVTLTFRDAKGAQRTLALKLPVSATAPAGASAGNAHKH